MSSDAADMNTPKPTPAPTIPEGERRLTPTEREHALAMAFALRPHAAAEQTVSLSRNARGIVQIEVTLRGDDAGKTAADAIRLFESLHARYPYPEATGNG